MPSRTRRLWIPLDPGIHDHPKAEALADRYASDLGVPDAFALDVVVAHAHRLFAHAAAIGDDGVLGDIGARGFAAVLRWPEPSTRRDLLAIWTESGFLDDKPLRIHDFEEWNWPLIKGRFRSREKRKRAASRDGGGARASTRASTRARARPTETETETENTPPYPPTGGSDAPNRPKANGGPSLKTVRARGAQDAVEEVWLHWAKMTEAADTCRLTEKTRSTIHARVDSLGAETCKLAVDFASESDFHKGENGNGRSYLGIRTIFRSDDRTQTYAENQRAAERKRAPKLPDRLPDDWVRDDDSTPF